MKKLLGIMAVVALLAAPVLAVTKNAVVNITVEPYAQMTQPADLHMTVNDIESAAVVGGTYHQASSTFTVTANKACTLTITVPQGEATAYKTNTPGGSAANPTAFLGLTNPPNTGSNYTDALGYGLGLSVPGGTSADWIGTATPSTPGTIGTGSLVAGFPVGATTATLGINSYIDSNRTAQPVAAPGEYVGHLILTLAVNTP